MVNLRLPNIKGTTEREQLKEMQSYLYQIVEQLQFALNTIEGSQQNTSTEVKSQMPVRIIQSTPTASTMSWGRGGLSEDQATFQAIKPLIIKSADIVNAYYEEINARLEGLYVAQSDFGAFAEKTSQDIEATSTDTTQKFNNIQVIITGLDSKAGSLESDLLNISEEFSYTQRDIIDITSNIETIGSHVENLGGIINEHDEEIKTVGETVSVIDSELKTVGGNVVKIDSTLKTVESNVGTLDTEVKGVKTGVQNVTQKVSNVDTELQGVKSGVHAVEQKAQTLEGNLGTIGSNVEAIGSNVQEIETDLQDTKVGIDSSIGRIADEVGVIDQDLQGVKAGMESGIKDLSDEVGKVDSKIEDAKSAIGSDIDKLKKSLDDLNYILVEVNANIKTGLIDHDDNGIPIYGLEIGQKNTINGVEVFNKFARFSAGRLSFYDNNGTEVAYISDYKLYITHAEVKGTLKLGGYLVDTSNGVTFKWVGRS